MSTWLDYYISGAAQTESGALGVLLPPDLAPKSDLEAMRLFARGEDEAKFGERLVRGFGRGIGFGFGMMEILGDA